MGEVASKRTDLWHEKGTRVSLPFSERKVLLGVLDLLAINSALLLVAWLRLGESLSLSTIARHPHWFILLTALWLLFAAAFDAYDLGAASVLRTSLRRAFQAAAPVLVLYAAIPYITPPLLGSRLTIGLFPVFAFGLLLGGRGLYVLVLAQPRFRRPTLIVGAGKAGRALAEALSNCGNPCYEIVGFVDDDPKKQATDLVVGQGRFKVLGDSRALKSIVAQHGISTIVLAITREVNGELLQVLMDCLELGVDIIPMPVLYEELTGRVPIEHVGSNWYVAMPLDHPGSHPLRSIVKRAFDIVSASLGMLFLGVALPFIALAIYMDSPGPIFYTQERVGKGGRTFKVYKFRSMVPDAEQGKAVWAKKDDPRVTRVGRLLRKTHVDEFPQFLNILKGEMSAVGPRPERPEFVEELAREIPFYRVRHAVKPGMAGWGLVKQGYGASKEDAVLKLQYDLYYIKHQSLWLDMVILLKTVLDTLTLRGR